MDWQSIYGKTPIGVARLAQAAAKAVIAIVGSLREDYEVVYQQGINAVFPMNSSGRYGAKYASTREKI